MSLTIVVCSNHLKLKVWPPHVAVHDRRLHHAAVWFDDEAVFAIFSVFTSGRGNDQPVHHRTVVTSVLVQSLWIEKNKSHYTLCHYHHHHHHYNMSSLLSTQTTLWSSHCCHYRNNQFFVMIITIMVSPSPPRFIPGVWAADQYAALPCILISSRLISRPSCISCSRGHTFMFLFLYLFSCGSGETCSESF